MLASGNHCLPFLFYFYLKVEVLKAFGITACKNFVCGNSCKSFSFKVCGGTVLMINISECALQIIAIFI